MIEPTRGINLTANAILICGIIFILSPLLIALIVATQSYEDFVAAGGISLLPGRYLLDNIIHIVTETNLPRQVLNSIIIATCVATIKCSLAFAATFALVFFDSRWNRLIFALTIATVMLPLELIVVTTYQVVANVAMPLNWLIDLGWYASAAQSPAPHLEWNLLDSFAGIAAPIATSSTSVFIYRQFFLSLPRDLPRAAAMDGAGPLRFLIDILLPLSKTPLIATFIFWFVGGWTNYLWPLVAATSSTMQPAIVGLSRLATSEPDRIPEVPMLMAGALFVSLLPVLLIAVMQGRIVKGLNLSEK
ncbi:carbohydrate ABC transporter permease [Rhizobium sp. SSA_523]|uniref:carbohydrate ABC transporter permease n=1 Tax=Rhizobium sp. SSA_523 TaxID=2952477 RepID=UPI002090D96B|nr:ABC transporter permease subunit [Rhizobium sp. SSA_523]MCO5733239.1 ABC transporter permease subunit [Rhizobium sp. SSA_523]WKC21775.1 ABC transporter permease subunit [Rhizobium sp. SSA_523]